jgi:hypothetical protein
MFFINSNYNNITLKRDDTVKNEITGDYQPHIANGESILFQGVESALNVTDYGVLYESNQEIIISNLEELNLNYDLDDDHNWKVSKIENNITNIYDTRNWVNNSGFQPVTVYREYQVYESSHNPYSNNADRLTTDSLIQETGALYIRAHFTNVSFHDSGSSSTSDHLYIYNSSYYEYFEFTGNRDDFYSPWVSGDTLDVSYQSDNQNNNYYGYRIDYYEFINDSSNINANLINWKGEFNANTPWGANTLGFGEMQGADAMFLGYHGDWQNLESFTYYSGTYSEVYQENIQVPRGNIIDAYINFDYLLEFGFTTNNIMMYLEVNDEKIYSKGMLDIAASGKNIWHNTGNIPLYLWENTTEVFDTGPLNDQTLNITVGIKNLGGSVRYTGYEDVFGDVVWFDNISLVLTTVANASQDGINLTINSINLDDGSDWGRTDISLTGLWDVDPVTLTLNTTSSSLSFDMDTTLYGYHDTFSSYNQQYDQGILYNILDNGTILWELYHNLYMPDNYENFEFSIKKPVNWEFFSVIDPFLQIRNFEYGNFGDNKIYINKSNALFAGWYALKATSPNFLNNSNTKIFKQDQWVQNSTFGIGDSTQITTQLKHLDDIPNDVGDINLTIYNPNGTIFYTESKTPVGGNVTFSQISFGAFNTSGGLYEYTLFWSNGTAVGGLKSSFIINHHSTIDILKPNDAIVDLRTDGFVGDIIPVRILLKDIENNFTIPNAIISYNWSDGTHNFTDAGLGIYETTLFTGDLASRGLYYIVINSSKIGFTTSNITLEINLGEETNILVLESEYNIELHANSTIRFKFSDFDGDGIDGAIVNISITNVSLYSVNNPGNGTYDIEFSTLFIDNVGIHQININFSAVSYEPQHYIYQFQIIKQSVNLSVYLNSIQINENSLRQANFTDELNISVQAISNIDKEYLSGNISCIGSHYQNNLTEYGDFWFNSTIICSPDNFSFGINFIYLQFEHPNYRTSTFGFQLLVNQVEINIDPIGFEDTINIEIGQTIEIQFQLLDPKTANYIENVSLTYTWDYGAGPINETSPGNYQTTIKIPENLRENYKFVITATPKGSVYKITQYSFIIVINELVAGVDPFPSLLLWIIIAVLVSIVSALGILSLRSYVILPRKRKKEADLISKTQKFKDLRNIQAIVIIHRLSGIPLYTKTYSILEKHKKELFSGFIQAITTIGEEFTESEKKEEELDSKKGSYGIEKIIELDFKYFYCLITDKEDIRVVFVLKEKSSERLKSQISLLMLALGLKLSQELEDWDGSLEIFEEMVPPIINEYFELYYKGSFRLPRKIDLFALRKDKSLSKMEIRVLNVIESMSKRNDEVINLNSIIELVSEENKDLIIEAIEVLIEKKIIIPVNL